ncbi:NAD(P)H-dependent oxidoreductase [Alkalimonas amylolytica]|uniref:NADPH-dependent FMN reductase n=1 Tax=Alkalimonas amylolytica TaxID=152573 RepID=A0A1H4FDS6_ALKAM|nr:NAD(P)H-dependent oxidoreductase [Alkalimonas amylolytica]SEA95425.1 NADPH-dependent FMN reductase [Alkalimonas amylolytica]
MNALIICASQRQEAESAKVSQLIGRLMEHIEPKATINTLYLADFPRALHCYGYHAAEPVGNQQAITEEKKILQDALRHCTMVIVVTPEWGGMIPPALTNLFLLSAFGSANGMPLAHKPGFIVSISASEGGHYPISQLRGYTSKNSHLTWIPLHCIIRHVERFLQHPWSPEDESPDSHTQSRLITGLTCLIAYESALKTIREALLPLSEKHPFGQ